VIKFRSHPAIQDNVPISISMLFSHLWRLCHIVTFTVSKDWDLISLEAIIQPDQRVYRGIVSWLSPQKLCHYSRERKCC
jgi:hypothetical protein